MTRARDTRRALPVVYEPREMAARTWLQMIRTFSKQMRLVERALEKEGLSLAQFDVLATLRAGEGISQQELAERLLVTKGNVCGLLDRLESSGYVTRRPDPQDRRANRLYLTEEGRAALARAMPGHHAVVHQLLGGLGAQELQLLYKLLDRLEEAADA